MAKAIPYAIAVPSPDFTDRFNLYPLYLHFSQSVHALNEQMEVDHDTSGPENEQEPKQQKRYVTYKYQDLAFEEIRIY